MTDSRFDVDPSDWMDGANCAGMDGDIFFTERGESTATARSICAECVIRRACAQFALDHNEKWGTWGGLSAKQRLLIKRRKSTLDVELAKSAGHRCVVCDTRYFPDSGAQKTCSAVCAARRGMRRSRRALRGVS